MKRINIVVVCLISFLMVGCFGGETNGGSIYVMTSKNKERSIKIEPNGDSKNSITFFVNEHGICRAISPQSYRDVLLIVNSDTLKFRAFENTSEHRTPYGIVYNKSFIYELPRDTKIPTRIKSLEFAFDTLKVDMYSIMTQNAADMLMRMEGSIKSVEIK